MNEVIEEGDEDKEEGMEEMEEEAKPKIRRAPNGPTRLEREDHEVTHLPFRSWCEFCVKGRGISTPHRVSEEEKTHKKVAIDYFYFSRNEGLGEGKPHLVMKDERTGNVWMRVADQKGLNEDGTDEWLARDAVKELKAWGYPGGGDNEVILKSDGEPAILKMKGAIASLLGGKVTPEEPETGEHQANGSAEVAGKNVRSMARTLMAQIEQKAGMKMEQGMDVYHWLIRWAAMVSNRYRAGKDGKTAYQEQTGRRCKIEVIPFGEQIWYQSQKNPDNKMDGQWKSGTWLGQKRQTNGHVVHGDEGVEEAWTIRRKPSGERWNKEGLEAVKGTPGRIQVQEGQRRRVTFAEGERAPEVKGRRTYFKDQDFEKHGYTEGCPGCASRGKKGLRMKGHTEECRKRLEGELEKTQNQRWKRAEMRGGRRSEPEEKHDEEAEAVEAHAREQDRKKSQRRRRRSR